MSTFIYAWNEVSEGAKALAETMGVKRIKHENSRFRGRPDKTVINWGSSNLPEQVFRCKVLNKSANVAIVSNKLTFFKAMAVDADTGPRIPEFTTDQAVAREWLVSGKSVCARERLQGSGGEGLTVLGPDTPNWIVAPLYTLYKKKRDEYRVHVVNGVAIDVQRKALKADWEGERNTQIRNLANGYIFAREGFETPADVTVQALKAMAASGLDFGAVDVIFNGHEQQAYVLEINSAPGLVGTTLTNYATAFGAM